MKHRRIPNANSLLEAKLSPIERLCRQIAEWTGAPIALLGAIVLQTIWIVAGVWTRIDPFPFVFLLTVSNVIQLILIFVIAVAQRQQSLHDQLRAEADHEALCHVMHHQDVLQRLLLRMAAHQGVEIADLAMALDRLAEGETP